MQLSGKIVRDLLFGYGMNDFVRDVVDRHSRGQFDGDEMNMVGIHIRSITNLEKGPQILHTIILKHCSPALVVRILPAHITNLRMTPMQGISRPSNLEKGRVVTLHYSVYSSKRHHSFRKARATASDSSLRTQQLRATTSTDVPGIGALNTDKEKSPGSNDHDAQVNGVSNMGGKKLINHRASCDVENFIPKMRRLLQMNAGLRFYVAADSRETYKKLIETFGEEKIDYLQEREGSQDHGAQGQGHPNDCYDDPRTAYCTQLALAEVILVSTKTFKQILSTGSSYSALITMISGYYSPSGCAIGHNKKKYKTIGVDGKRRDVSIVAAMTPDRLDILLGRDELTSPEARSGVDDGVLQSWLRETSVEGEIIIVVWMISSQYTSGFDYSDEKSKIKARVGEYVKAVVGEYNHAVYPRLVRCVFATVDDAAKDVLHTWLLPVAYNLGISLASGRYLLKLDADNILAEGFFKSVQPEQHVLYRGIWCSGAEHINGVFLAPLGSVINIRGYDERLVIYGADDSDIYQRLIGGGSDCNKCALMLKPNVVKGISDGEAIDNEVDGPTPIEPLWQRELSPEMVMHKDHSNAMRVRNQINSGPLDGNATVVEPHDAVSDFVGIRIPMNPTLRIKLNYSLLQNAYMAWHNVKENVSSWRCSTEGIHAYCSLAEQAATFPREAYNKAEIKLKKFMKKSNKSYDYLPEENAGHEDPQAIVRDPNCHLSNAAQ